MKTTLVTVVNGSIYENFSDQLFRSAEKFFHPTDEVFFLMLYGRPGWPDATMYRYHVLAEHMPDTDYVFLSDADMVFEGEVGAEILPPLGISATLHPGYVTMSSDHLPYERRPSSSAGVHKIHRSGTHYYCGGFVGGDRENMLHLSRRIATKVEHDVSRGIIPVWHDESCLNRCLIDSPPMVTLSPSYCYPADDSWYRTFWTESYERKLVALDKTNDQRGER